MKCGVKEETMKKFIYITVAFMLVLIFIGCYATTTSEQRKETYDMRENVGNSPFIGSFSGYSYTGYVY